MGDRLHFAGETCAEMGVPCTPTPADLDALESMMLVDQGPNSRTF